LRRNRIRRLPSRAGAAPSRSCGHTRGSSRRGTTSPRTGSVSIALPNTKAVASARRLIYVEDLYSWSEQVGNHFATALAENSQLRLVVVLPTTPDLKRPIAQKPML